MQKKAEGKVVFDQVLRRLGVSERDYFGLEYEDDQKLPVSLVSDSSVYRLASVAYERCEAT